MKSETDKFITKSINSLFTLKPYLIDAMEVLTDLISIEYLTYEEVENIFLGYIHFTHLFLKDNDDIKPLQLHRSIVRRLKVIQKEAIDGEFYEVAENIKKFLTYNEPRKNDNE